MRCNSPYTERDKECLTDACYATSLFKKDTMPGNIVVRNAVRRLIGSKPGQGITTTKKRVVLTGSGIEKAGNT